MTVGFAGLAPCVHCGFCLQSCPTFLETGDEADGPRGRIRLMQALAAGAVTATDPAVTTHLDRCLGCRGCEPVCPSGVRYGLGLEAARRMIAETRGVSVLARWTLVTLATPGLCDAALLAARMVRPLAAHLAGAGRIGFAWGMLAATRRQRDGAAWSPPAQRDGAPDAGRSAAPFLGCVQRGLFAHVHAATERTLGANGYRVVPVRNQGCCGALHAHAGLHEEARRLARRNVGAFAPVPEADIVVNSAGCGAMLRAYDTLLADDPLADAARRFARRVVDVSEALATAGPRTGASLPMRVAYDPPCHLEHAQRVSEPPRRVLAAIPDLDVAAHADPHLCCGSAGIYSLLQPELSRAVLARKVAALRAVRPELVVTGNPGCLMHIGAGLRATAPAVRVAHPVELLDRSYARAGFYRA